MPEVDPLAAAAMRHLNDVHYKISAPFMLRWAEYGLGTNPIDIHRKALGMLGLKGHETVLDGGCGHGSFMELMREAGHTGEIIGLDRSASSWELGRMMRDGLADPGIFLQGDIEDTRLPDNSVDAASELFVIYHATDPHQALEELRRIVKPNGVIIIGTSGEDNKYRSQALQQEGVEHLGGEPGQPMNAAFTTQKAKLWLPAYFEVVDTYEYIDLEILRDPNLDEYHASRWDIKLNSLSSYDNRHFTDKTRTNTIQGHDWWRAIRERMVPLMMKDIETHDAHVDLFHRSLHLCKVVK